MASLTLPLTLYVFHASVMVLYCDPFKLPEVFILLVFHIHWALSFFRKARNADFRNHTLSMASRQVFINSSHLNISCHFSPFLHCPALCNGRHRRQLLSPGSSNMHPSVQVAPPDTSVAHTHSASCFQQPGCSTGPQHHACIEKLHLRVQIHLPLWTVADTSLYTLLLSVSF